MRSVRTAEAVLWFAGLVYIPFGLWALAAPGSVAGLTEVALPTPTALADGRAVYGGLTLGLGIFFIFCAVRPETVRAGLLAMFFTLVGPALGRSIGIVADGAGSDATFRTLTFELTFMALALVALWRRSKE